ncbi:GreA/GreB family elongation factor [Gaetbulibacter saemankumensis]|uniref:GreA/GreB family elongation factor n=1 Tax=Gaetbulibacter saemankumensis TaxID=311208 RepID=UPI000407AF6B|nr:GreA/GreB family elongation factor [Gaetbulibacter saemankumensis]
MNNELSLKTALYNACVNGVGKRLEAIKHAINDIQESLTSETKSSAGDKHETGRAMLQLEREKSGNQLAEIQKLQGVLSKIRLDKKLEHVSLGAVVFTTQANYFISVSAGEINYESQRFYAISSSAPIGQLLMGKKVGDEIIFRGQTIIIEQII